MTLRSCSQTKSLLSNASGSLSEARDNGIDGISRYSSIINHSDVGTLTKHGTLKMAASATQV